MYKNDPNAIKRARNSVGVTQEKLAEMAGCSVESIKCWENGSRIASTAMLDLLGMCLNAPWLTGVYLREQAANGSLDCIIPDIAPNMPLSQAALTLISCVYAFVDKHSDRRLAVIAADNVIAPEERGDFDNITEDLQKIVQAAHNLRYSRDGK